MKRTIFFIHILTLMLILSCNEDMIQDGVDSSQDPRVPEINVKLISENIPSGGATEEITGVKSGSSKEIVFTIENLGTAELELSGNPVVAVGGADAAEFLQAEITQPPSVIPGGRSEPFTVVFTPESPDLKTATITIQSNDADESVYSFTIRARSKPVPDFNARVRKGISYLTVDFEDKSSGDVSSWSWDFDSDGTLDSTSKNPVYRYNKPGTYSVNLTINGPGGDNFKVKNNYITVSSPIEINIDSIASSTPNAISVFATDLDGDNGLDVLYTGGTEAAWWPNNGSGSFGDKVNFNATFTYAQHILAVNLDTNPVMDVIVVDNNRVLIWNNYDGSDTDAWDTDISFPYVEMVCTADIDGQNGIDILLVGGSITWYSNDGSGNFSVYAGVGSGPFDRAVLADIDGDDDLDIIASVSSSSGGLYAYENTSGDGLSWTQRPVIDDTIHNVYSMTATDLDNDGDLDIVATGIINYGEPVDNYELIWWENTDGNGNYNTRLPFDYNFVRPRFIVSNDIDSDGDTDLLSAGDSVVALYEQISNGNYLKHIISYNLFNVRTVYAADMDNNNDMDMLAAGEDEISWFNITLDGWYRNTITNDFDGANSVITADIDNDQDFDIVSTADGGMGSIAWWENTGNGNFADVGSYLNTNFTGACSVFAADIDKDNDMDIIGAGDGSGAIWWENFNDGQSWDEHGFGYPGSLILGGRESLYIADMDNDDDLDLLESWWGSAYLVWWENEGAFPDPEDQWNFHSVLEWIGSPLSIKAIDIDNDDDLDILAISEGIRWWENIDGLGNFPDPGTEFPVGCMHTIEAGFSSGAPDIGVIAADIDGDEIPDVIGAAGNEIAWWKNNGDKTFGNKQSIEFGFNGASSAAAADIDGDGDNDIIGTAMDDDKIKWWENINGDGSSWIGHIVAQEFDGASSVTVDDIDNDGDMDIIATAKDSGEIVVWENNLIEYGE